MRPLKTTVKDLIMEVRNGASVTVISEATLARDLADTTFPATPSE